MKSALRLVLWAAVFTVAAGTSVHAGGDPKGKPFVSINNQIIEVKGAVSSIQDQIEALVERVDTIEERVAADAGAIDALDAQIAALEAMVLSSATTVADIEAEVGFLQEDNAELAALIAAGSGDAAALQADIAANTGLIADLESAILMVQNGTISLESSLQEQIEANLGLIAALQTEIELINSAMEEKQNLINGTCPDGSAVQQILEDGSVICGAAGSGGTGTIETVVSFTGLAAIPGETVTVRATCPTGYTVVSAGMTNASGWDIFRLQAAGINAMLIATNENSYQTWITAVATCMRLVP